MKQFSIVLMFFIGCSFSLLSCVGISPSTNSTENEPLTLQDSGITPPVLPKELATSRALSGIDPSCSSVTYEAWENDETGESGVGRAFCNDTPTPSPKKRTEKEEEAVATAMAYLGDKAPNMRVQSVKRRSSEPGYIIRLQQTYQGILVDDTYTSIFVNEDKPPWGDISYYSNIQIPSITPTISLDEAIAITVNTLGIEGNYDFQESGLNIIAVPTTGKYDQFILTQYIVLKADCPNGTWVAQINAYTGEVISRGRSGLIRDEISKGSCPTPKRVRPPTPIPVP